MLASGKRNVSGEAQLPSHSRGLIKILWCFTLIENSAGMCLNRHLVVVPHVGSVWVSR